MASNIRDYTVNLGLNNADYMRGLKASTNAMDGIKTTVKSVAAAFAGTKMFKSLVTDYMNYQTNLANSVQLMQYNITETTALGGVLRRFGGDTQNVVSSLDNLTKGLNDAKWGTGSLLEVSGKYGITFQKSNGQMMTSEELLMSLSSQLQKYDRQTRVAIASQLGLDESLQRAFDIGQPALRQMIADQKRFNKITEEDSLIAGEYEKSLKNMQDAWAGTAKTISNAILPVLTKVFNLITEIIVFANENNMVLPLFFMGGALAAAPLVRNMMSMLRIGGSLVKITGMMGPKLFTVAKGVGIVTKASNILLNVIRAIRVALWGAVTPVLLLVGKFIAIGVAIAAVLLVIQDVFYYCMGWDSVTGDLVNQFPLLGTILEPIKFVVNLIVDAFMRIVDFIMNPSWESFKQLFVDLFNNVIKGILWCFEKIKDGVMFVLNSVAKLPFISKFFGGGSTETPQVATPNSAQIEAVAEANKNEITQNNYVRQSIIANKPGDVKAETTDALNDNLKKLNVVTGTK